MRQKGAGKIGGLCQWSRTINSADVLSALRLATAERHATLDSGLAIGAAGATLEHYREHLCMLHAWLGPLATWLAGFACGPKVDSRLGVIEADLADMPMPHGACEALPGHTWPPDASAAYRWGVCYVIEGSQLGGAVLYKRLASRLAPHPLRYLRGEFEGPGPRWKEFVEALRGAVRTPADIDEACAGARDAFDRILALRVR